ncbi:DUF4432 family protein [Microbacterium sp. H1-D42]|uniref:DUF4432 family protein n=1 Tax=Microbacterium sp. H1-D42 TaxID=2925844 RepID=UPI001F538C80|nr:DUF4432 family protein [Microbacterium sp. H1-D42]UNK70449.1 DUF4432 family protein [Microbacterium sp. H1-D42]
MTLTLTSTMFEVTVTPERGGDIVQIVDLTTGIPTLSVSPTADTTTTSAAAFGGDSATQWTTGYPGGWQFLTPNAGPERVHDGVLQGYHGESALSTWEVLRADSSTAELTARLVTAPFALHRRIEVTGDGLTVTDTVRNLSPDDVSARMLHHPAFGRPFLDEHSYLVTDADTLLTDANAPGTLAGADVSGRPDSVLTPGPVPGSVALPGPGSRQALFGGLTDFASPEVAVQFASPTHGFAMELSWQREAYPMAWLWFEANAGTGFPWFRRMYAMAVEPGNVLPGEGTSASGLVRGGDGTVVPGGGEFVSTVRVRRLALP